MNQAPPPVPPYPPMTHGPVGSGGWEPGVAHEFRVGDAFSHGWEILKANYWRLIGAVLLCAIVYVGVSVILNLVPLVGPWLDQISGFFLAPLGTALLYMGVRAARGEAPGATQFFSDAATPYWGLVGISFLVWVISILVMLPVILIAMLMGVVSGMAAGTSPPAGGAMLVLLILFIAASFVALIYLAARLGFAGLLYMDAPPGRLGVIDAIKLSWRRTEGFGWPLVGLYLLLGLVGLASVLLLVVGVLFLGAPLYLGATAAAYNIICPRDYTGLCPSCGYDCRSSPPGTCPECGTPLPA